MDLDMEAPNHDFDLPEGSPESLDQFSTSMDDTNFTADGRLTSELAPDSFNRDLWFSGGLQQYTSNPPISESSILSDWDDRIRSPSSQSSALTTTPLTPWETPTANGDGVQDDEPDYPYFEELIHMLEDAGELTKPPTQTMSAPSQHLTMEGRPPGMTAYASPVQFLILRLTDTPSHRRQWRNENKPVKCPECGKGFSYNGERAKHIRSKHVHIAAAHNISTALHRCTRAGCSNTYTRKDYLTRHLTNKHGREKTRKGPKRQKQGGRVGEIT
jgi:hypothetical protein